MSMSPRQEIPLPDQDYRPLTKSEQDRPSPTKSDGGPTGYYDFLPGWVTLNDAMEWLAQNRWGAYSLHLKDSMKACMRFGGKDGVVPAYDAKKLVYSGLRLLGMASGRDAVRDFLLVLLADPQFRPEGEGEDLQALFEADIARTDIGFTNDSPEAHPVVVRCAAEWVSRVIDYSREKETSDAQLKQLILDFAQAGDLALRLSFVASLLDWFGAKVATDLEAEPRSVLVAALERYDEAEDPLGASFFQFNGRWLDEALSDALGRTRVVR